MNKEPENAKSEFFMAIVGPISSVVLAGIFFLFYTAGKADSSFFTQQVKLSIGRDLSMVCWCTWVG
jgi:hypothetical protein